MKKIIKIKIFVFIKKAFFIGTVIFATTFLQIYWAMGALSHNMSSGCIDCSFFEDGLCSSLFFAFFLTLLMRPISWVKNKYLRTAVQFILLAIVWFFLDYDIFVDRVSSWSTYLFDEEMNATISYSYFPILVLSCATLFIINYKKNVNKQ